MRNQFDNLRPPQHARAAARVLVGASHGPEQCAAAVQVLEGAVQGFEGELGSPREKADVGLCASTQRAATPRTRSQV